MQCTPLWEAQGLSIGFTQYTHGVHQSTLQVMEDFHLQVHSGEVVAIIGASGSGKSLLAHAILDILPYNATVCGQQFFCGEPLTPQRCAALRGSEIVLIPQSVSYLDPLQKVGAQVAKGSRKPTQKEKALGALARYGLDKNVAKQYPFELSGGMARRVLISTAVVEKPKLVIADEPTPGLHLRAARRVLGHLKELATQGAGVLLITHDLELALEVADRVVVLYSGTLLEETRAENFAQEQTLVHPYTKALWRAMPQNGFNAIAGMQPYAGHHVQGCRFKASCPNASDACAQAIALRQTSGGCVRCILEEGV